MEEEKALSVRGELFYCMEKTQRAKVLQIAIGSLLINGGIWIITVSPIYIEVLSYIVELSFIRFVLDNCLRAGSL